MTNASKTVWTNHEYNVNNNTSNNFSMCNALLQIISITIWYGSHMMNDNVCLPFEQVNLAE